LETVNTPRLMRTFNGNSDSAWPLIRPIVAKLQPYVPGEQPKIKGLVKLNTNENPYGPSPRVLTALRKALGGRLRLYPNPDADRLRAKLAAFHNCRPENIVVGNGSDELLALATRAFVEPLTGLTQYAVQTAAAETALLVPRLKGAQRLGAEVGQMLAPSRYTVQFLHPSYSLYPVLAAIHGAWPKSVVLESDFSLPSLSALKARNWDFSAALSYITTPNAPSGRGFSRAELEELCRVHRGVLLLDEAYVDFAAENAMELALTYPHVLVCRTFSKAYSLCFLRVGYAVGHPDLVSALHNIRDSYNVNGLAQIGAEATLDSLPYYRRNFRRIIAGREHLSNELSGLDFAVLPSQTNFILVRPPRFAAQQWLEKLRERKVLVRWFSSPELQSYLRITIGSDADIAKLLSAVRAILREKPPV
jgi:histidinol-phosphate aminotransferase